jgi:hypothetical protein
MHTLPAGAQAQADMEVHQLTVMTIPYTMCLIYFFVRVTHGGRDERNHGHWTAFVAGTVTVITTFIAGVTRVCTVVIIIGVFDLGQLVQIAPVTHGHVIEIALYRV